MYGDLGHSVGGQTVENTAVSSKHISLILIGSQGIVDVGKTPGLTVLAVDLPNPISIDFLDRDGLLDAPGYLERDAFPPVGRS